jgi:hypothetical protein
MMKNRFKGAVTVAVLLLAFGLLGAAFHLMNESSDLSFYGGIAIVLSLVVLVPTVVIKLWKGNKCTTEITAAEKTQ